MWLLKLVIAPVLIILVLAYAPEIFPDHGILYEAILKGDLQRLRTLLDRGADPNVCYSLPITSTETGEKSIALRVE